MQKEDFYKGVKTVGFVTFIPFMLAAGPLSGYFAGTFLQKKFNLSSYIVLASVAFGFIIGAMETIKILKAVSKIDKK
jgi:hypothetical protein